MLRVTLFFALMMNACWASSAVTVYAASSLTNVMDEVVFAYQHDTGKKIRVSYAGSSSLARQIANGAPADIYVSANTKWMDYLVSEGQIEPNTQRDFLKNSLVLVASNSTPKVGSWQWFMQKKDLRLSMADPRHVPAGIYAKQSLEGQARWATVSHRIASGNNVRSALLFVERDEAPLGIVYKTDALSSKGVTIVEEFPDDSHDPIIYPLAIVKDKSSDDVIDFYDYLLSDLTKKRFIKYGFTPFK